MPAADHHGIFGVADRMVGVPLEHLGEVCVVSKVSPMMDPNPGLLGVIGLRNMLVPLLDVPHSLGLPARTEAPAKAAILRLTAEGSARICSAAALRLPASTTRRKSCSFVSNINCDFRM